ncbi:uncharacterized protein PV06_10904 [Exophiala oligosperma]|uniref:Uncharacterized protein n=1 Tax=Exophiala oligosperma TaxID=215243 RepID=A0A0D2A9M1_9EURO|nr:uncharacterized protein PV06_10904 [Exophiala oligosperma]KIW37006.1 hypothetical protein PV06_10904 [Exophiala oligosperma]
MRKETVRKRRRAVLTNHDCLEVGLPSAARRDHNQKPNPALANAERRSCTTITAPVTLTQENIASDRSIDLPGPRMIRPRFAAAVEDKEPEQKAGAIHQHSDNGENISAKGSSRQDTLKGRDYVRWKSRRRAQLFYEAEVLRPALLEKEREIEEITE